MTRSQFAAIRILNDGLVRFEGRWVWPTDMRADRALAARFMAWYYS